MTAKITSRFFTARRRNGDIQLFIRGRQIATVFIDGSNNTFWVGCADKPKFAYDFKTFQEADAWAWRNYA